MAIPPRGPPALPIRPRFPGDARALYLGSAAFCMLEDRERAIDWLDRSVDHGFVHKDWILHDPTMTPILDDPRVRDLLDRI